MQKHYISANFSHLLTALRNIVKNMTYMEIHLCRFHRLLSLHTQEAMVTYSPYIVLDVTLATESLRRDG